MQSRIIWATISLVGSIYLSGCGKKKSSDDTATMSLKVKKTGTTTSLQGTTNLVATGTALGDKSFTPSSFKVWIDTIVLQNDQGASNQFYTCTSSATDCEVDFANADSVKALEAKLNAVTITPGTYTKVWMSCNPSSGGYIKFKGSASVNGVTKYTATPDSNSGSPITTDSSKNGDVTISLSGCGITMNLSKTLTVAKDDSVVMTMFSDLTNIAYFAANQSSGMGGCKLIPGSASADGFCINYPSVFPYFGETTPTVESYIVAHRLDSSVLSKAIANTFVKVIKTSDGTPFWASFGSYFTETTPDAGLDGAASYANSVTSFAVNSDGTLTIKSQDYGFSAFQRADHTGDVVSGTIVNGAGTTTQTTYKYHAYPFTP